MPGCAFGICDNSKQNGGQGCYLCDIMPIKFPQQPKTALQRAQERDVTKGDRALTKRQQKKAQSAK
jgi:hypothetical protein